MDTAADTDWRSRAEDAERRAEDAERRAAEAERRAESAESGEREARRRAAEAWGAYHRVAATEADAEHWRERAEILRTSLSWRITAPLRLAKRLVAILRAWLTRS